MRCSKAKSSSSLAPRARASRPRRLRRAKRLELARHWPRAACAAARARTAAKARAVKLELAKNARAAKAAAKAAAAAANPDALQSTPSMVRGSGSASPSKSRARTLSNRARSLSGSGAQYHGPSEAATSGIALLKQGVRIVKYTQQGRRRLTTLRLTRDEKKLVWEGKKGAKLGVSRSVTLADVIELLVGCQTHAFEMCSHRAALEQQPLADPHLSLSLVLKASLPATPADVDGDQKCDGRLSRSSMASSMVGPTSYQKRGTLDLSIEDEEAYSVCVAALRQLLSESRHRPAAYPSPLNPIHASAIAALHEEAPADATRYEHFRDACLLWLDVYTKTTCFKVSRIRAQPPSPLHATTRHATHEPD